jgi:hypothetical protein
MIVWFRDSKNDAKKGIWGEIVKLFAFASTIVKFGKKDDKKRRLFIEPL